MVRNWLTDWVRMKVLTSITQTSCEGLAPYLPSFVLISLNMSSEAAEPWLLRCAVLSTSGRWMMPSYPRSQWAFPASPEVIPAPSALMLLVAVVSALRMMSSSTSATLRTSPGP